MEVIPCMGSGDPSGKENIAVLNINFSFCVEMIFERYWGDDSVLPNPLGIGKSLPKCCEPFPETYTYYLCNCGKHIIRIFDEGKIHIRRIFKLTPTQAKFIKFLLTKEIIFP